jgi:hypothetical protein
MASPTLTDQQLARQFGRRGPGQPLFEPQEFGYRCPKGHGGDHITWSEFKEHIWCYQCKLDYPSKDCPIQRPSCMSRKDFNAFVRRLPFKPQIIPGVDRSLEAVGDKRVQA